MLQEQAAVDELDALMRDRRWRRTKVLYQQRRGPERKRDRLFFRSSFQELNIFPRITHAVEKARCALRTFKAAHEHVSSQRKAGATSNLTDAEHAVDVSKARESILRYAQREAHHGRATHQSAEPRGRCLRSFSQRAPQTIALARELRSGLNTECAL